MFSTPNQRMVRTQLENRGISDPRVLAPFARVPRHHFVANTARKYAYEDRSLTIGAQQTISQPYVVAFMLEQLELKGWEPVLEIGTGSGYQTALLAELAAQVYSVEYFPELAQSAQNTLCQFSNDNIDIRSGDGSAGWPDQAPFDAIIGSAAPAEIPQALEAQLALGAKLILPVGTHKQWLFLVRRTEMSINRQRLLPVRFVPMLSNADD
jgi:protein-L-isoaspartate(D-aspartate) O-methyltransferase